MYPGILLGSMAGSTISGIIKIILYFLQDDFFIPLFRGRSSSFSGQSTHPLSDFCGSANSLKSIAKGTWRLRQTSSGESTPFPSIHPLGLSWLVSPKQDFPLKECLFIGPRFASGHSLQFHFAVDTLDLS